MAIKGLRINSSSSPPPSYGGRIQEGDNLKDDLSREEIIMIRN